MKKQMFERKGRKVLDLTDHVTVDHKTVNAAKKWSRKKQIELDGALGRGSVRAT